MADMSGEVPMRISELYPDASAIIRKYESVNQSGKPHLEPYLDEIGGVWTVGFGRVILSEDGKQMTDDKRKEQGLTEKALIPWALSLGCPIFCAIGSKPSISFLVNSTPLGNSFCIFLTSSIAVLI